ncbi:hypothetical protein SK128_021761, partial [Halocaridina rubra]
YPQTLLPIIGHQLTHVKCASVFHSLFGILVTGIKKLDKGRWIYEHMAFSMNLKEVLKFAKSAQTSTKLEAKSEVTL